MSARAAQPGGSPAPRATASASESASSPPPPSAGSAAPPATGATASGAPAPAPPTASGPAAPATAAGSDEATKQACLDAFKQAQRLRNRSELLAARRELVACGQPRCPEVIRGKCVEWLEEVRDAIPTVLVAAADAAGNDVLDAAVLVDGRRAAGSLDGAPIELDPGPHTISVVRGRQTITRQVVAIQGSKDRLVRVKFPRVPTKPGNGKPSPETARGLSLPMVSWVGFGVGATGLAAGTATGIAAILMGRALREECQADVCHPAQKDDYYSGIGVAHASTVTMSIGGAGVIAGVVGLLVVGPPKTGEPPPPRKGELRVTPLIGPAMVGAAGRF